MLIVSAVFARWNVYRILHVDNPVPPLKRVQIVAMEMYSLLLFLSLHGVCERERFCSVMLIGGLTCPPLRNLFFYTSVVQTSHALAISMCYKAMICQCSTEPFNNRVCSDSSTDVK